jgi:hypothetical protein
MTLPAKPNTRGKPVYRVQITDWVNGRRKMEWVEITGPRQPNGWLPRERVAAKGPRGLMSGPEAREIAAQVNRTWAAKPREKARVVKDEVAVQELGRRQPTGDAA